MRDHAYTFPEGDLNRIYPLLLNLQKSYDSHLLNRSNTVLLLVSIKTIKNVDEETWRMLKELAKKRKLKMGGLLREITSEYKKKPSDSWSKILKTKPSITLKEAEIMLVAIAKIRKEDGYRDVSHT